MPVCCQGQDSLDDIIHEHVHSVILQQLTTTILSCGADTPLNVPLSTWNVDPPAKPEFHGPTRVFIRNGFSIGSAVFAQRTVECPITSQWGATFPPKLPLPLWDEDGS